MSVECMTTNAANVKVSFGGSDHRFDFLLACEFQGGLS